MIDTTNCLVRLDSYIRRDLPIWFDRAGIPEFADQLRNHDQLREEANIRSADKIVISARNALRKHRKTAKLALRTIPWNAYPAWDAAWNSSRTAGWDPAKRLFSEIGAGLAAHPRNALLCAGHAARAAAWKVAWTAAVDDGDEHDPGVVVWNALKPVLQELADGRT